MLGFARICLLLLMEPVDRDFVKLEVIFFFERKGEGERKLVEYRNIFHI